MKKILSAAIFSSVVTISGNALANHLDDACSFMDWAYGCDAMYEQCMLECDGVDTIDFLDGNYNGYDGYDPCGCEDAYDICTASQTTGDSYGSGYTYPPSSYYIDFFLHCNGGYGGYINMTWMDGNNYNYFFVQPTETFCYDIPWVGKLTCGYGNGYYNGNVYPSAWCINLDTLGVALLVDGVDFECVNMDQGAFIPINWAPVTWIPFEY